MEQLQLCMAKASGVVMVFSSGSLLSREQLVTLFVAMSQPTGMLEVVIYTGLYRHIFFVFAGRNLFPKGWIFYSGGVLAGSGRALSTSIKFRGTCRTCARQHSPT